MVNPKAQDSPASHRPVESSATPSRTAARAVRNSHSAANQWLRRREDGPRPVTHAHQGRRGSPPEALTP